MRSSFIFKPSKSWLGNVWSWVCLKMNSSLLVHVSLSFWILSYTAKRNELALPTFCLEISSAKILSSLGLFLFFSSSSSFSLSFFFFAFLGLHPQHMEVPRPEVQSELQLHAYATATATSDLSCMCDLHTTAHGNAGSLTHWVRPGVEPTTLWFLVGFISALPQRELLLFPFLSFFLSLFFFYFFGLHLQHMEIPRLGVKLEL